MFRTTSMMLSTTGITAPGSAAMVTRSFNSSLSCSNSRNADSPVAILTFLLLRQRVPESAHIGACPDYPGRGIKLHHGRRRRITPGTFHIHFMTAGTQLLDNGLGDPVFDLHHERLVAVIIEGAVHRVRVEAGCLDRLLRSHPKFHHVQENLQEGLILTVTARG